MVTGSFSVSKHFILSVLAVDTILVTLQLHLKRLLRIPPSTTGSVRDTEVVLEMRWVGLQLDKVETGTTSLAQVISLQTGILGRFLKNYCSAAGKGLEQWLVDLEFTLPLQLGPWRRT